MDASLKKEVLDRLMAADDVVLFSLVQEDIAFMKSRRPEILS